MKTLRSLKHSINHFARASALQIALAVALILLSAILLASSFAPDISMAAPQPNVTFNFTTIDVPGATNTGVGGINNLGHIVGGYNQTNSSFPAHGFLDVGGTFTSIDNPNATSGTVASNINVSDQIVGSYNFIDPAHPFEGVHGFLLSGGIFTAIDYPAVGVTSSTPNAINDFGDVVGVYRMNSPGIAFLLSGGVYTSFVYPGGCCTHANDINNFGQIVGQYKTPDDTAPHQGFLKTGATFTTVNYPGATDTKLQGINNFGDIVGQANSSFGFLYKGGSFFSFAVPGAAVTFPTKINDNDQIVGIYLDASGLLHGFEATITNPTGGGVGTIGYWANHPAAWCVSSITLGCQTYTKSQAIAIMNHSTGGDMTYQLGAQLAAAKLNVGCTGTNSSCVASAMAAADSWLCSHPIGSNVTANSQAWKQITPTYNTLTNYNEGLLCAPPR